MNFGTWSFLGIWSLGFGISRRRSGVSAVHAASAIRVQHLPSHVPRPRCVRLKRKISLKKCILAVDGLGWLNTLPARLKRDSRVARQRNWFWPEFGTANWNSILSRRERSANRLAVPPEGIAGERLSFFCGPKTGPGRWFFDIYIQGSKYNF